MMDGAVQLCSTCMVTLTRLVIKGERKGTGPVYDVFTGRPGSKAKVHSINTYRLREACTPAAMQLKAITTLPRSAMFPNSSAPQAAELRDITYRVGCAPETVALTAKELQPDDSRQHVAWHPAACLAVGVTCCAALCCGCNAIFPF